MTSSVFGMTCQNEQKQKVLDEHNLTFVHITMMSHKHLYANHAAASLLQLYICHGA